jgi:hypothetical protein
MNEDLVVEKRPGWVNRDFVTGALRVPLSIKQDGEEFVATRLDGTEVARGNNEVNAIRNARQSLYDTARQGKLV